MALDLREVEKLIRTEENPVELSRKLREMIESAHPAPVFKIGEEMAMYEFERLFKKKICKGNETTYQQWRVRIKGEIDGEVCLGIGVYLPPLLKGELGLDGKPGGLNGGEAD